MAGGVGVGGGGSGSGGVTSRVSGGHRPYEFYSPDSMSGLPETGILQGISGHIP